MSEEKPHPQLLALCIMGISTYWSWGTVSTISAVVWRDSSNTPLLHYIWISNVTINALTLFAALVLAKKFSPYTSRRLLLIIAPLFVIAGTGIMNIGFATSQAFFVLLIGSALSGIGFAGILLFWGESFLRIPSDGTRRFVLSASIIVGFLIFLIVICLPSVLALVINMTLPFLSVLCIMRFNNDSYWQNVRDSRKTTVEIELPLVPPQQNSLLDKTLPISLLLCCFIFVIPLSYFRNRFIDLNIMGGASGWPMIASCALLLSSLILVVDYFVYKRFKSVFFSKLIAPLLGGGLLVFTFLNLTNAVLAGIFIFTGHYLFMAYIYSEIGNITTSLRINASKSIALGTCFIDLGFAVGSILALILTNQVESHFIGVTLAIVYLIFLVGLLFFPQISLTRTGRQQIVLPDSSVDEPEMVITVMRSHCGKIAKAYMLSPREEEIFFYLIRGRSAQTIADAICLSRNTVKSHMAHLYAKLGVHTREELVYFFEHTSLK
jgi:DNA-binding CsgD family transcriptional regulator